RRRSSPPFPYTTLSRSLFVVVCGVVKTALLPIREAAEHVAGQFAGTLQVPGLEARLIKITQPLDQTGIVVQISIEACLSGLVRRSEEHTSELQSRENLV